MPGVAPRSRRGTTRAQLAVCPATPLVVLGSRPRLQVGQARPSLLVLRPSLLVYVLPAAGVSGARGVRPLAGPLARASAEIKRIGQLSPVASRSMDAENSLDDTPAMISGVGDVVVAAGHVEWELRRLLLSVRGHGPDHNSDVSKFLWAELVKKLRAEAGGSVDAADILAALDRADRENLAGLRNMVVHAYWQNSPGPRIRGIRQEKNGNEWNIVGDPQDLTRVANKLKAFVRSLKQIGQPDSRWPDVYLVSGED